MTLKQLEDHLGKRLFQSERKNQLSPLGKEVYELARKQVRYFDETIESIETAAQVNRGLIRIVSVPSVATLVFPSVLGHMTQAFPGLKLELRDTDTQQVMDALSEGRADIGIASGHHLLNGVRAIPMFEDRFGLVSASDHPIAKDPKPPLLSDISAFDFVQNPLCRHIQNAKFHDAVKASGVMVHNTHSLIAMVQAGSWVTVLPETVARFLPETTAFRHISDLVDVREVYLYVRERSKFRAATEECCTYILSLSLV